MRASICYSSVAIASSLTIGATTALAPIGCRALNSFRPSALSALPTSSSGPWGSRGGPSQTARESAFNVEWEPMTELDRRIEDGIHYEHMPSPVNNRQQNSKRPSSLQQDGIPSARGVFVGYRFTEDEYNRLKSADPEY